MTVRRSNALPWLIGSAIILLILVGSILLRLQKPAPLHHDFAPLMIEGRTAFENADGPKAIAAFEKAVNLEPTQADAHLNLANAYLLAGQSEKAIAEATEVLRLSKNSAAALYIVGCANLRLGKGEEALKALQQSQFIDPTVAAVSFHLGRAHQLVGHWEDAAKAFREVIEREPQHPAAHYALSQVLIRSNDPQGAQAELKRHSEIIAKRPNLPNNPTIFEKCEHTAARLPAVFPEQPATTGVKVTFVDATDAAFGASAHYRGPVGVIDVNHDGHNSLVVAETGQGIRLLINQTGKFEASGPSVGTIAETKLSKCLVGDLDNDQVDDVIVLGDHGTQVFKIEKPGTLTDVTIASGLRDLRATDGVLADLDFTGKLGLIAAGERGVTVMRNQGNMVFQDATATLGIENSAASAREVIVDDWNGDDLPDLFIARNAQTPQLLLNQHGGALKLVGPNAPRLDPTSDVTAQPKTPNVDWPNGSAIAVGDLNCDLRADLVVTTGAGFELVLGGIKTRQTILASDVVGERMTLIDYDNDGWLDIVVSGGRGLRIWRNVGWGGFKEVTGDLGLSVAGPIDSIVAADFDADGDTDLVINTADRGIRLLRNDGGNANNQIKLRLPGKRSNASGLGARIELVAGGWRTTRDVRTLPIEIGVGQHARLDSLSVHWADVVTNLGAVDIGRNTSLEVMEAELPAGSCPYLYVWNGERFRFVTDLLGASPAGLRLADDRFVDADTDELVGIGNEESVKPRDGSYVLNITDELRELLFFDQVQLVVADHPADLEVHSTSKLRPGKPFARHELIALSHRHPLLGATRSDGADVTEVLAETDRKHVSPMKLRVPQLRGLAEPFSVTVDFGPLDIQRPLVLALTGWLRFGGGMANVAASRDPTLPFPFPMLEAETAEGAWQPVDVVAGAPAGKTKTIIVDLTGKLPAGARRLRLSTAFEIHWDRIAMFERDSSDTIRRVALAPNTADLHWHGSGEREDYPWFLPVTPIHDKVRPVVPWLVIPAGWCTRYGDVKELLEKKDNALVILNCGDEVTLTFAASELPPKAPGDVRDFFVFSSGWDKDADYHVEAGLTVEPIPWHGMDDQRYGHQPRPVIDGNWWIAKYNTRWIGPMTLSRDVKPRR